MQRNICNIFERLTNRAKPKLTHPTATSFSLKEWLASIDLEMMDEDDVLLTYAALVFGNEINVLREHGINDVFANLDRLSAIRLGVASVNRAAQLASKLQLESIQKNRPQIAHADVLSKQKIPTIHGEIRPDTAMTAIVDALPHWFFQAKKITENIPNPQKMDVEDCLLIHRRAEMYITLERALKELWQEILWEPWTLNPANFRITSNNRRNSERWIAWQLREDALLAQAMRFDLAMGYGRGHHTPVLHKTVSKVVRTPKGVRIKSGHPIEKNRENHFWRMEMAERSYLGPFLDLKPNDKMFSIRDLLKVWFVLCDFGEAWTLTAGSFEFETIEDVERVACEFSSNRWLSLIRENTKFEDSKLSEILELLTADPLSTSDTFTSGFWHRPFVKHPTKDRLMCLVGMLSCANPIYTMEHWLRATDMIDNLGQSSLGIAYEANLRESISNALESNPDIQDYTIVKHAIKKKLNDDEEIDFLLRIGNKVIVGEIKCFVRPADSIQKFDYIEKLNAAASQVKRKSEWISKQPNTLKTVLNDYNLVTTDLEFVPMVILNSSAGMGLVIDGVICTEEKWLKLILGSNSYSSGLMVDYSTNKPQSIFTQIYSNQASFESKFEQIMTEPAGLNKYLSSLVWNTFKVPTMDGREFIVDFCELDNAAMIAAEMGPQLPNALE